MASCFRGNRRGRGVVKRTRFAMATDNAKVVRGRSGFLFRPFTPSRRCTNALCCCFAFYAHSRAISGYLGYSSALPQFPALPPARPSLRFVVQKALYDSPRQQSRERTGCAQKWRHFFHPPEFRKLQSHIFRRCVLLKKDNISGENLLVLFIGTGCLAGCLAGLLARRPALLNVLLLISLMPSIHGPR